MFLTCLADTDWLGSIIRNSFAARRFRSRFVVSPKSIQGFINLLAELHLSAMRIGISHQPSDRSPVVVQETKVVHRSSMLIHTSAKNFDSFGIIEAAVQVV